MFDGCESRRFKGVAMAVVLKSVPVGPSERVLQREGGSVGVVDRDAGVVDGGVCVVDGYVGVEDGGVGVVDDNGICVEDEECKEIGGHLSDWQIRTSYVDAWTAYTLVKKVFIT